MANKKPPQQSLQIHKIISGLVHGISATILNEPPHSTLDKHFLTAHLLKAKRYGKGFSQIFQLPLSVNLFNAVEMSLK